MAELHEIVDQQYLSYVRDALDELYQTGVISTADLPTFEQSLRDLLTEKGGLAGDQIESIVAAVSEEIGTNYASSPVDFATRSLFPEAAKHLHEVSGLYYDESGNWYNPDGTPSAYFWMAEHDLFYDAAGNWYHANLNPYQVEESAAEAASSPAEAMPTSDEAVPVSSSETLPADVEEVLSGIIDEVLEKVPGATNLSPDEFAELLEKALQQEAR